MRWMFVLALLPLPLTAQYTLYTCMVTSKDYVVGAKLPPSGIFIKPRGGRVETRRLQPSVYQRASTTIRATRQSFTSPPATVCCASRITASAGKS